MSVRRLLVTGGAGFIGSNFVAHWLQRHGDDRLVVLDALTYAGCEASLARVAAHPGYRFVHGDIRDEALVTALMREERIDTIVHFAAESHVDRSIDGPDAFIDTNIIGTHVLLKAARRLWQGADALPGARRFHHVSTDEVYGSLGMDDPAFTEETRYAPNSPYSASKAGSDHLVRAYHHTYGLDTTLSNCSNNYGPYHFPEKLIPLIIVNLLRGKPLPVYGDGLNVRDWLFVTDHCRAIEMIVERGRAGEVYNVGGRAEVANIELVRTLCRVADELFAADPALAVRYPHCPGARGVPAESLIQFVTDRPGHDRRYAIDAAKIEAELGFMPEWRLADGLRHTLGWYMANQAWWEPLLQRAASSKTK